MYVTKIQLKLDNKVFPFTGLAPERNAAVCVDSFQDPLRTRYGSLEIKNKNETCHIMDPCLDIDTTRSWAVVDFFICLFVCLFVCFAGEALNIDPRSFYSTLYSALLQIHVGK